MQRINSVNSKLYSQKFAKNNLELDQRPWSVISGEQSHSVTAGQLAKFFHEQFDQAEAIPAFESRFFV